MVWKKSPIKPDEEEMRDRIIKIDLDPRIATVTGESNYCIWSWKWLQYC